MPVRFGSPGNAADTAAQCWQKVAVWSSFRLTFTCREVHPRQQPASGSICRWLQKLVVSIRGARDSRAEGKIRTAHSPQRLSSCRIVLRVFASCPRAAKLRTLGAEVSKAHNMPKCLSSQLDHADSCRRNRPFWRSPGEACRSLDVKVHFTRVPACSSDSPFHNRLRAPWSASTTTAACTP